MMSSFISAFFFLSHSTYFAAFAGDDSSNEDQSEERAPEDGEPGQKIETLDEKNNSLAAVPEEGKMDEEESEEEEAEAAESEEFSFPDTTISLSHLQPNR